MATYIVNRTHEGDRFYNAGEERTAEADTVAHLVAAGVLTLKDETPAKKSKSSPNG